MLTDAALKALKPRGKMYKVSDRDGMYVRFMTSGATGSHSAALVNSALMRGGPSARGGRRLSRSSVISGG